MLAKIGTGILSEDALYQSRASLSSLLTIVYEHGTPFHIAILAHGRLASDYAMIRVTLS